MTDEKGGSLLGLFGRSRRKNRKDAQSTDGFPSQLFGDAEKMPLAKFLMIAEENLKGYPSRRVPCNLDGGRPMKNATRATKMELSSPNLVARLMGLEPLPFEPLGLADKGKLSIRGQYKVEKVASGVDSNGSKIRREQRAFDVDLRKSDSGIMEHKQEFRERTRWAMKNIPSERREFRSWKKPSTPVGEHFRTHSIRQSWANDLEVQMEDSGRKLKASLNSLGNYIPLSRNQKDYIDEIVKESISEKRCLACGRKPSSYDGIANFDLSEPGSYDFGHSSENRVELLLAATTGNSVVRKDFQTEPAKQIQRNSVSKTKDLNVVAFTSGTCEESGFTKEKGNKEWRDGTFHDQSYMLKRSELGGDELGALLERKIAELKNLDQDDTDASDADDDPCVRSSAIILEELIIAMTNGKPFSDEKVDGYKCDFRMVDDGCDGHSLSSTSAYYQQNTLERLREEKSPCASFDFSLESDCYEPSPMSILEASFSAKTHFPESVDVNSGRKWDSVSRNDRLAKLQTHNEGTDSADSATSIGRETSNTGASHILESISIMYQTSARESGDLENKLSYEREVISNIKLLFGSVKSCRSVGMTESSADSLLLDTLEALIDAYRSSIGRLICPGTSEGSQIRKFLFDCMVEHLDLKYGHFCRSGYRTWTELSVFKTSEELNRDVSMDVNKWMNSEGEAIDVIVSKELRKLPINQTAFQIEVYELGMEIGHAILQGLVDESLIDLLSV